MAEKKATTEEISKHVTAIQNPSLASLPIRITAVPFVVPFTKPFIWMRFNAEQVCFTWIVLGVISGILFGFANYWLSIISLVIFHISAILDGVDGAVARYWKRPTVRGAYLDAVGHAIIKPAILMGLGVNAFMNPPDYIPIPSYIYLIAGGAAAVSMILVNLSRLKVFETLIDKNLIAKIAPKKEVFKTTNYSSLKGLAGSFFRIDPFSAFYFAVIFDVIGILILFYAVALPTIYISRCVREFNSIRKGIDEAKEGEMTISLGTSKH